MRLVITGISRVSSKNSEEVVQRLKGRIRLRRFVTALEQLTIAAVGSALDDAGISFPVGDAGIGIYIGIDDAIEDIKDEYFQYIVDEKILGASPLLFPYTSPNALAAQASIAFDIRGESLTSPIEHSYRDVIEYSVECLKGKYITLAVTGCIMRDTTILSPEEGRYCAEFYVVEALQGATERKARIYQDIMDLKYEVICHGR